MNRAGRRLGLRSLAFPLPAEVTYGGEGFLVEATMDFFQIQLDPGGSRAQTQVCASLPNYRLVSHFKFLIVGPDQTMVTKRL